MAGVIVTEAAMRPAAPGVRRCFYCHEAVGAEHKADCVCVVKRVKIRATIEYEVTAPSDWDKHMVEFQRNDGSWCANNMLHELEALKGNGCLCNHVKFEYLGDVEGAPVVEEA